MTEKYYKIIEHAPTHARMHARTHFCTDLPPGFPFVLLYSFAAYS